MQKTVAKKTATKTRVAKGKKAKTNENVFAKNENDHRVSRDFLATRESRYQLVDIIDYLFDAAIG